MLKLSLSLSARILRIKDNSLCQYGKDSLPVFPAIEPAIMECRVNDTIRFIHKEGE